MIADLSLRRTGDNYDNKDIWHPTRSRPCSGEIFETFIVYSVQAEHIGLYQQCDPMSSRNFIGFDENGCVLIREGRKRSGKQRILLFGPDMIFRHDVGHCRGPEVPGCKKFMVQGTLWCVSRKDDCSHIVKCIDLWRSRWDTTS